MDRRKIVCFGDSNTYGYDPRGFLGMRYATEARWTTILQKRLSAEYRVIEEGQNGRMLPQLPRDLYVLEQMVNGLSDTDILVIMLGTNDLFLTDHPDAAVPVEKMKRIIQWYKKTNAPYQLLIVGPVLISAQDVSLEMYHQQNIQMNDGYQALCNEYAIFYVDAGTWNIPLAYDGVHFLEEGHRLFAEEMEKVIREINPK